jgi:hypothetical protein
VPRRNRIDPWGDLHAVAARGTLTGNRGCLVDGGGAVVRHHASRAWICCELRFRDWRQPPAAPNRWTPLFFLDEAVALAAGHRPCATCRRDDYRAYRDAVAVAAGERLPATELDRRLAAERAGPGRGLVRAGDRIVRPLPYAGLPDGAVVVIGDGCALVLAGRVWSFTFAGWTSPAPLPRGTASVLTPPTSLAALANGYAPRLSAG